MKAAFIIPKNDDQHQQANPETQCRILPPVGLARMAGIMGKQAKVSLLDERITPNIQCQSVQIAIIFINSYNQHRAHDIARHYRAQGSFVVMTGSMLSNTADLPSESADSLFIGSGEEHITKFLADYQTGKTKQFYRSHTQTEYLDRRTYLHGDSSLRLAS